MIDSLKKSTVLEVYNLDYLMILVNYLYERIRFYIGYHCYYCCCWFYFCSLSKKHGLNYVPGIRWLRNPDHCNLGCWTKRVVVPLVVWVAVVIFLDGVLPVQPSAVLAIIFILYLLNLIWFYFETTFMNHVFIIVMSIQLKTKLKAKSAILNEIIVNTRSPVSQT